MNNKTLREQLIGKARKDAQAFSMEEMALNTEKVYREVL
jgi:hypothetical protein